MAAQSFAPFRKLHPLPLTSVRIDDPFWSPRLKINREVTIPYVLKKIRETGRLANFLKAAGKMQGEFQGIFFDDSDVHKWLEGAAYSIATHPDTKLEADVDEAAAAIASAQQPDGYLNCYFTIGQQDKRWSNLRYMHELYCAGHFIEAAVAHHQATGKTILLDAARQLADCIGGVFGPGKRRGACGHEEIELALVKLYRATGEKRYLELSQFFIDVRGTEPNFFLAEITDPNEKFDVSTMQAHKPVREQAEVVGHAVRAMYLYSGMTDLYAETGDKTLLDTLEKLWASMAFKRMYITGGLGSTARHEGFTSDYDLPNDAYAETCAAIASVLWNHRMLMLGGEARFADLMELALYNGVIAGVSLAGDTFFYQNPLRSRGGYSRVPWFDCACCPSNVVRLLASLGSYIYSMSDAALWVHLYVGGTAAAAVGGKQVTLTQKTDYPLSGDVKLVVNTASPAEFSLNLRIPGWCGKHKISVNRRPAKATRENGYACIRRTWSDGDTINLSLQMDAMRVEANPHVEADFGKVAIQRGPIIYCLEEADNGRELFAVTLPRKSELKAVHRKGLLGGVKVVEAMADLPDASSWGGNLYRKARGKAGLKKKIIAVPYCCWANRGAGEMVVWVNSGR